MLNAVNVDLNKLQIIFGVVKIKIDFQFFLEKMVSLNFIFLV